MLTCVYKIVLFVSVLPSHCRSFELLSLFLVYKTFHLGTLVDNSDAINENWTYVYMHRVNG